ncbi:MAG: cation-transporting P-type ATPase [Bacteroidota bacterium]
MHGLSTTEAEKRLSQNGLNQLQDSKKKSIAGMLLSQFKDVMIFNFTGRGNYIRHYRGPC